jgi:tetratricopeptide (TPR) repeat protein
MARKGSNRPGRAERSAAPPLRSPSPATVAVPPLAWTLAPILIVAAILTAYAGAFTTPFLFDDTSILETRELQTLSWRTVDGTTRPLVQLSLALNWLAGGSNVVGYHLFNVGVHALAALTLFGLVARTLELGRLGARWQGAARPLALVVSLLFAVHPLQTQSVTYVVQRAESLMALCYLLTLYALVRGAGSSHPARWYGASVTACALGMMMKPVMVTAPVTALCYDAVFLAGSWTGAWRRRRTVHVALMATWLLLVGLLTGENESAATAGFATREITLGEYAGSQPHVVLRYLQLAFWPHGLVLDYGWPPATGFRGVIVPTFVLGLVVALALWIVRRSRELGALVVAFLLMLAPSSSLIPIKDLAFEHRMYLPLAPLLVLVVAGAWMAIQRLGLRRLAERRVVVGIAAATVVVLMALTVDRNHDYRSAVAMWTDVVAKRPANARGHSNLGLALVHDRQIEEGITSIRTSLRLDPTSAEAHNNWGFALARQKRFAESEPHYREAIRLKPAYAEAHNNLGVALMEGGRPEEAALQYGEALRLRPEFVEAYSNLGNVLAGQGRIAESMPEYLRALAIDPTHAEVQFNLALALARLGRRDEALARAAEALRLRPTLEPVVRQAGLLP